MMRKSQGITLNTVIIAVLGILVLVTLAILLGGKILNFGSKTQEVEESAGNVDELSCKMKCDAFNRACIKESYKESENGQKIKIYYHSNSEYCKNNLYNALKDCEKKGFVDIPNLVTSVNNGKEDIEEVRCKG